jgi:Arc/MetJ-type ribon-helix-helix transcriptional regulator
MAPFLTIYKNTMSLAVKDIDNFLTDQVENGSFSSASEVEQELLMLLVKRDIDRGIEKGERDFANGDYEEVNAQTNAALLAELAQELLPNH